jgi:hypothetical protein
MNEVSSRVPVTVPIPIAEGLRANGLALPSNRRRGPVPELMIEAAGVGATVISLLQTPETLRELARLMYTWTRGRHDETSAETHLIASGPDGRRLELTVTGRTDMSELESLLQRTVFAPGADSSDAD